MIRRLIEFWVRREACKMAAIAIQNHVEEDAIAPRVWSLAVFFETYMWDGAEGTRSDFGPKQPVSITVVEESDDKKETEETPTAL